MINYNYKTPTTVMSLIGDLGLYYRSKLKCWIQASTPLKRGRSLRPEKNDGNINHAYFHESRGKD